MQSFSLLIIIISLNIVLEKHYIQYCQTIAYNDIGLKSIVRGPLRTPDLKDIIRKLNRNCMEQNISYDCTINMENL